MGGAGLLDQDATACRLMVASSPIGPMVFGVVYLAHWTAHSSFCSSSIAVPTISSLETLRAMIFLPAMNPVAPDQLE